MEQSTEPQLPVVEPGKKRQFPLEVRRQILAYYDALPDDGSKGAYLRRSGLYAKSLREWRKQADDTENVPPRGRRALTQEQKQLALLRKENADLVAELAKANAIIEVQKKVSALLELHATPKEQRV